MKSRRKDTGETSATKKRKPRTVKSRDRMLINLATERVEQRLRDGTATAAEIIHYLRLGSEANELETEMLKEKTKMIKAKTSAIQTNERMVELYDEAKKVMSKYGYRHPEDDDDEDDDDFD